jgi:Holliday junction resolvasome RuvABC endonuclease subunit
MSAGGPVFYAMRILCLDASTHAGWSLMEGEPGCTKPTILGEGLIENDQPVQAFGAYPGNYIHAATSIANRLFDLVIKHRPDVVVIEETNLGKNRYAQKLLEFIHCSLVAQLVLGFVGEVVYLSSSSWRQALDLRLDSEQRRNNAKIAKARKLARETGISINAAKKKVGVKGKITKKHLAVNRVNEVYSLGFKVKDNDRADAICLGLAYFVGAEAADGIL